MTTLRQEAEQYEAPKTQNVADLQKISTEYEIQEKQGMDNNDNPFSYKYIEIEGTEYRVPKTVIAQIQDLLQKDPDLLWVKVTKSGVGMNTRYRVDSVKE